MTNLKPFESSLWAVGYLGRNIHFYLQYLSDHFGLLTRIMCSSFLRQFLLALSQGQVWVPLVTVWSPFRSVTPSPAVGGGPQDFSYNTLVKAVRCFEKHLGFSGPWISYFIIFKMKQWMIMNLILLKLPVTGTRGNLNPTDSLRCISESTILKSIHLWEV